MVILTNYMQETNSISEQDGVFAPVMEVFMWLLLPILVRLYSTHLQLSCTAQSLCQVKQLRLYLKALNANPL
jgi:hypothetical protein